MARHLVDVLPHEEGEAPQKACWARVGQTGTRSRHSDYYRLLASLGVTRQSLTVQESTKNDQAPEESHCTRRMRGWIGQL
jgi:hypothetical protein